MFGSDMRELLLEKNQSVDGFNRTSINLDWDIDEITDALGGYDVIINAVAYTAVDKAESETELANKVNGDYAGKLALAAERVAARFMHISTDYVFDGNSASPYKVTDTPNPQTAYGLSKLLGENLVSINSSNYIIFRTAWLYGKHGRSFPKVMRDKAYKGDRIRVVSDQYGQPTWTKDLARQVLVYARTPNCPKIVHAVASGKATWFDFANSVLEGYAIEPISSDEFITPAKRPRFSVLDNSSEFVEPIADWRRRWEVARIEI
jgi:dTDP-4-dehydrorhamnose reductase